MDRNVSRAVSEIMGIAATQDLGRYLCVPLLHGRVKRSTYYYILTRLDNKLAGWKANNLSLVGRVTLASSVLNAIPSYIMQTVLLPASICDGIDRKIRNFIWGSVEGARRIHNINWETICKPKSLGGLGLRNARDLNKAFLMKIVWGLISHPSDLWERVLISKYLKKSADGYVLARNSLLVSQVTIEDHTCITCDYVLLISRFVTDISQVIEVDHHYSECIFLHPCWSNCISPLTLE
ncbi:Putative ribonuclease H protein At1g65750 [Linum perenne]